MKSLESRRSFSALVIAGFLSVVAVFSLAAIGVEIPYRDKAARASGPIYVRDKEDATFTYRVDETFIDSRLVSVMYLEPLRPDIPPPPGLSAWPAAGSAAVTRPALRYRETLEQQFGPITAVIDDSVTLEDELLVITRPVNTEALSELERAGTRAFLSSGFAVSSNGANSRPIGSVLYERWAEHLLPLVLAVIVLPIFLYVLACRKNFQSNIAQEQFILQCIGARRGHLIRHASTRVIPPVLLGGLAGSAVVAVLISGVIRLPFTGFHFHPQAFLPQLGWIILALLVTLAGLVLFFAWPRIKLSMRPARQKKKRPLLGLALFTIGIILAAGFQWYFWWIPSDMASAAIPIGIILVLLGLSATFTLLTRAAASLAIRSRRDHLTDLTTRWIIRHPEVASRSGTLAGCFLIIGTLLIACFNAVADTDREIPPLPENLSAVDSSLVCRPNTPGCLENAVAQIHAARPDAAIIAAGHGIGVVPLEDGQVAPENLELVLSDYLAPLYGAPKKDLPENLDRGWLVTLVESDGRNSGEKLLSQIHSLDLGTPIPALSTPLGENTRALAQIYRQHSTWLSLFTTFAFICGLLVVWLNFSREAEAQARDAAAITALTGQTRTVARILARRTLATNIVTGIAALAVGTFLARQFLLPGTGFIPWEFILTIAAIYGCFIAAQSILVYRRLTARARAWRPGKDHHEYSAL
ncbi:MULTISPECIES: hypothetical protein [unclassified Actinotignum]|uniref:hypothetical protein n=1 Tax=unclassified Actinotignum TaxID=2632702 RepID=UPI003F456610